MSPRPAVGPYGALYGRRRRPASWVCLTRRPERAVPTALVIVLVTMLLVVVITPGNTFRATLEANLAALRTFTVVSPAQRAGFDPTMKQLLDRNPYQERWILVQAGWVRYPTMIGEGSCPMIVGRPEATRDLLDRLGVRLIAGRHPSGDRPEVVLHEGVARARGLRIGSRIGSLADPDDAIPGAFVVVGLVRGGPRVAVGVIGSGVLASMLHGRMPVYALVYPRDTRKAESDRYLHAARDGAGPAFQVIDEAYARQRGERALRNLPLLVRFVSISSAVIVALVATLLSLLSFQSRIPEFAVQIALGVRHEILVRALAAELSLLAIAGWLAGAGVGLAGLAIYDLAVLRPRGILMRVWDPSALLASAAIPILVVCAGVIALHGALRRIDPIAAIARRMS